MCWPLVLSITRKTFRPPRPPQAEQMAVPSAMQFRQFSRFFPADLLLHVGEFLMGLMDPGAFHLSALNGPFWWETRLTTDPPTSRRTPATMALVGRSFSLNGTSHLHFVLFYFAYLVLVLYSCSKPIYSRAWVCDGASTSSLPPASLPIPSKRWENDPTPPWCLTPFWPSMPKTTPPKTSVRSNKRTT